MVYADPIIRPLGDCYVAVEFGDSVDMPLCFRVLALEHVLEQRDIPGVLEIHPTTRELAVLFDRSQVSYAEIEDVVMRSIAESERANVLPSRLFEIPIWYDDPWSAETARMFDVPNNIALVAAENNLTVPELIERHAAPDYWIALMGAPPGNTNHFPLDGPALSAPKYSTPRTFTPARAVGIGGGATCIYGTASPGGYQLIGRSPVDVYQRNPQHDRFPEDGILYRAGDRIRYRGIDALEYDELREQALRGEYNYPVWSETFDVKEYMARGDAPTGGRTGEAQAAE